MKRDCATVDAPAWLTARPIAHRGLHCIARGVVENSIAAAEAAIAKACAIECDLELAGDGEAVVFHDETLDRLTFTEGRVARFSSAELETVAFRGANARIRTLPAFLAAVAGRTPLVIEIKSRFDGDFRLPERALEALSSYAGPAALKSFDPVIVAFLRARRPGRPVGLIAQAHFTAADWPHLSVKQRVCLEAFTDFALARPDFLSWNVADLPHAAPQLCRHSLGLPVMTWTVRTDEERRRAAHFADQIIFEGFEP
ncbi:glycerophosphodiester phosphodiesterase family protein [Methylocella silvestris]|uniref:Glycerophosphodiester phosphodiesterase n=1 Tax=Methylocella silvestris TaxID=199596 RepID=A0A2J7TK37_METSI|nr:glycerophosphodiester phosphodiesterase family protein [Methylocella silvestris]PNG27097.1 glycerophosphodiester phosphodiesterase [Methylocella silvestris]